MELHGYKIIRAKTCICWGKYGSILQFTPIFTSSDRGYLAITDLCTMRFVRAILIVKISLKPVQIVNIRTSAKVRTISRFLTPSHDFTVKFLEQVGPGENFIINHYRLSYILNQQTQSKLDLSVYFVSYGPLRFVLYVIMIIFIQDNPRRCNKHCYTTT